MPRLRNAASCLRAAEKAAEWLDARCESTEDFPCGAHPLSTYCKVPQVFLLTGRQEKCRLLLHGVHERLLAPGGALRLHPATKDVPPPAADGVAAAWIAVTAQMAGRFELSLPVARGLLARQGAVTGGVHGPADGGCGAPPDTLSTACAGLAFLMCGLMDPARRAGAFLQRVAQQEPEERSFFVRLDAQGRTIRDFTRGEAPQYVLTRGRGPLGLGYLALPIVLLTRLHAATGEEEWLDAAMDYYAAAERFGKDLWVGPDAGAFAWGAAALYDATRRRVYYESAEAVAQSLVEGLKSDGHWPARSASDAESEILLTTEAALCLLEAVREAL